VTVPLRYAEAGRGSPVVLLHSGGLSSRQWGRLMEQLARAHRVLSPDFIGYGRNGPWKSTEEFHFVLDLLALEALLDEISEPSHLVGHSYGGFVALLAALHRPRQVRSLALFEPVAFGVLHSRTDKVARASFVDGGVEAMLLRSEGGGEEPWLRAFVDYWGGAGAWSALPEPARAGFRAVGWKLFGEARSLLSDRTPHQAYASIAVPTLLLSGDKSPLEARHVVAHLAEVIPKARAQTLAGVGHMAPVMRADEVNRLVADHIAQAERTTEP
jgi:pimeloyl-ACP methyl ester carboxylesterase